MTIYVDLLVRVSLILGAGLIALVPLRRQPAALRHTVIGAAILLAALQPAMNRVLPAWKMVSPMGPQQITSATALKEEVETTESFVVASPPTPIKASAGRAAAVVWLAGFGISLAVLLIGSVSLLRTTNRATLAGRVWQEESDRLRLQIGLKQAVRVLITRHPSLLVTWGLARPVILLPADAGRWSTERVRIVLAHELAHVKRGDWLAQLAAELIAAAGWFHPLIWIACARLRKESELACDDAVLALGIDHTTYAGELVDLARRFSSLRHTWLPAPSMARPSTLERRIRVMLNPETNRRPVSNRLRAVLVVTMLLAGLAIASAAQSTTATGRVLDTSDRPLPDASVRLSSVTSEAVFETKTDASGSFQMPDLPAGDYLLSAQYPGFSTERQFVTISGPVTFALRLKVGTLRETVTVRADSATADTTVRSVSQAPQTVMTAPACGTTEVGGNIKPPRKVRDVRPRFKQAWKDAGLEGTVLMQATIGIDGHVKSVEVVSPLNQEMDEEAMAAVSQWRFTPTYLNCDAVDVRMFVTVAFKLER